jgi:hypothetical protein
MVKFQTKILQKNKLYIPKAMQNAGFKGLIDICPNQKTAVIYPSEIPADRVIKSLELILQELKLEAEYQKKEQ